MSHVVQQPFSELEFAAEQMLVTAFKSSPHYAKMKEAIMSQMKGIEQMAKKAVVMDLSQPNLRFKVEAPKSGKFARAS